MGSVLDNRVTSHYESTVCSCRPQVLSKVRVASSDCFRLLTVSIMSQLLAGFGQEI
jgi:hypothetical protein